MRRAFVLLAAVAALGVAGPATAGTFKGTVVAKQRSTLLVAGANGAVRAIGGSARIGARVVVSGARLRAIGRAHRAIVRGVVVRRSAGVSFLSAANHVLVVHTARRLASASDTTPTTPQPGAVVQTNVAIADEGDLEEQDEHQVGRAGNVQVQATVASVAAGSVTLTVNGQQLTINLPAGLTLPATVVGTQVTLNVSFAGGAATAAQNGQHEDDDEADADEGGGGDD